MEAFITKRGITTCPPAEARSWNPARANRDDSAIQPFVSREEPASELQRLASAKILYMLRLLGGSKEGTTPNNYPKALHDARRWFFEPNNDFDLWCESAGFEPSMVRKRARSVEHDRMPIITEKRPEKYNVAEMTRYAEVRRWKEQNKKSDTVH